MHAVGIEGSRTQIGHDLFAGPGEMHALCRALDWSATPLGPVAGWPLSLRTTVATLLASRHPMFLFWGPELVQIYNDAYRPSLAEGGRHPRALGMRGADFWTDIWDIIGPQIAQVMSGGPATWHEDDLVPIERNGRIEEVYWTYSYGPAFDDDGEVGGVLVVCQETTSRVLTERHLQTLNRELERERARLRDVFEQGEKARERISGLQALSEALSTAATGADIAEAITAHAHVILGAVGAVVAQVTPDGTELELLRASDMPEPVEAAWHRFPLSAPVPIADVARTGQPLFLESREQWRSRYPALEPMLEATGHHANAVMPLIVGDRTLGVLGAAFDAPRVFDDEDRAAATALARQCAQALERARLLEAERAAREEAESASRAKSQFLAVMSHELRTPLNAIGGYAELLEMGVRGPITDEQAVDLHRIQRAQRHLAGLVTDVLDYVRIETGRVEYRLGTVALDPLLNGIEVLIAPQLASKRLDYRCQSADPTLTVFADAEKVTQILVNLVTNALKFTAEGGRIVVSVDADASSAIVRVRDTGVGIDSGKLATIFEPFVQVDRMHTRTNEGVGLGLTISRDLARGMGGELTVESTVGAGSTFSLRLPRVA